MNPKTATPAPGDQARSVAVPSGRSFTPVERTWTPADAAELYGVERWGSGYFGVSEHGTVVAYPDTDRDGGIDLHDVVRGLASREIGTPVIIRLPGVLQHRMRNLRRAFDDAIAELDYGAGYSCVYPIKVNQERHVCEAVRDFGAELGFGLEVGSKPELIAGLALTQGFDVMPLVCNGFKDAEYIETVVLAAKMGRNMLPVAEQAYELRLIRDAALMHDVQPRFGIRAKLATPGVGRWAGSSGIRGKFGLTVGEILHAVEYLQEVDLLDGFRMLHCHVGSQIFDIRAVKYTVSELAHLYVELVRAGVPIEILDLGGGLGVDYDGSQSATESSVNYTLDQYASDVVHRVKTVCDEAGVRHPTIMTESGRALVAHSSVLVTDVIGTKSFRVEPDPDLVRRALEAAEPPQPLLDLHEAYGRRRLGDDGILEVYADAEHALSEAINLFNLGYMDLRSRAACEELFWAVGSAALETYGDDVPEALSHLPDRLADLYFVNVSVFQSLLDSWGIDQVFPIMPIHRLDEEPTRRGILADITCDSDGRVDRFPGDGSPKSTLELHEVPGPSSEDATDEPYYLGIFLTGAYQETLGDLHNLLGDTNAVHVRRGSNGRWRIETLVEGETVREVLSYVQFEPENMRRQLRHDVEAAIEAERLTPREGASLRRFFDESLQGYTYLE